MTWIFDATNWEADVGGTEGGGGQRGAWKEGDGVGGGDDPYLGGDFCNCTGEL